MFCPVCGGALREGEPACPMCGFPILPPPRVAVVPVQDIHFPIMFKARRWETTLALIMVGLLVSFLLASLIRELVIMVRDILKWLVVG